MNSLEELFCYVVSSLESIEAPYMVVGSFASVYYGVARATQGLDIVCELLPGSLHELSQLFSAPDFYLSLEAARQAIETRGMFNVLHPATGWKIDFIQRKDRRREFARRVQGDMLGRSVFLPTAEDTILAKLEWGKTGRSERQFRDVAEVLDVQGEDLDKAYIASGIKELKLEGAMAKVQGPW